jgi:hypothetical protein
MRVFISALHSLHNYRRKPLSTTVKFTAVWRCWGVNWLETVQTGLSFVLTVPSPTIASLGFAGLDGSEIPKPYMS